MKVRAYLALRQPGDDHLWAVLLWSGQAVGIQYSGLPSLYRGVQRALERAARGVDPLKGVPEASIDRSTRWRARTGRRLDPDGVRGDARPV